MISVASDFYPALSEKYGLPIETIREIITYSWRYGLKRDLEAVREQEIYFSKLGAFKFKEYKLKYELQDLKAYIDKNDDIEEKLNHAKELYEKLLVLKDRFDFINQERSKFNEFIKKDSRSIQEPQTDLGGPQEQPHQEGTC